MKYTLDNFIMEQAISDVSFDDLQCEELLAEGAVLESLVGQYMKQANLLTYMQEDGIEDTSAFDIFAEGVIVESKTKDEPKEGEEKKDGFVKTVGKKIKGWILSAIKFIKKLIDKVINFFKGIFTAEGRFEKMMADDNVKTINLSAKLYETLATQIKKLDEYQKDFCSRVEEVCKNDSDSSKMISVSAHAKAFASISKALGAALEADSGESSMPKAQFKTLWDDFKGIVKDFGSRKEYYNNLEVAIMQAQDGDDLDMKLNKQKDIRVGISALLEIQQKMNKILIKIGTQAIKAQKKADKKAGGAAE